MSEKKGVFRIVFGVVLLVLCLILLLVQNASAILIINGYSFNSTVDASLVVNAPWLIASDQRYNDSLGVSSINSSLNNNFYNKTQVDNLLGNVSVNSSNFYNSSEVDNLLNDKLDKVDQRYNDSGAVTSVNSSKLDKVDQRYNDTGLIITLDSNNLKKTGNQVLNGSLSVFGDLNVVGNYVNLTVVDQIINGSLLTPIDGSFDIGGNSSRFKDVYAIMFHGGLNASDIQNSPWLLADDQRYNDSASIDSVNNSLSNYLLVNDQRFNDTLYVDNNFYNKTVIDNLSSYVYNLSLMSGVNGSNGLSSNVSVLNNFDGTYTWIFSYTNGSNYVNFTTSNLTGVQGSQGFNGSDGSNGTSFFVGDGFLYNNGSNVIFVNVSALQIFNDTSLVNALNNSLYKNVSKISFDLNSSVNVSVGDLFWDDVYKTLVVKGVNTNLQVGQEMYIRVYNDKAYNFTDGEVVYVDGAVSEFPTIALAVASDESTAFVMGMVTENISSGGYGFITNFGLVHNINTSGFVDGQTVYLSSVDAGKLSDVKPVFPAFAVEVGTVTNVGDFDGDVLVRIRYSEVDPLWNSEKQNYYNTTVIDNLSSYVYNLSLMSGVNGTNGLSSNVSVLNNFDGTYTWIFSYTNGSNYANFTTSNLTGGQGVQGFNGSNGTSFFVGDGYLYDNGSNVIFFNDSSLLKGNGSDGYLMMWSNGSLVDSPVKQFVTDEDDLLFYYHPENNVSTLYVDDTNGMSGVNIPVGSESHAQAFEVMSPLRQGSGSINSTGIYDSLNNVTLITSSVVLPESFVDASSLYVSGFNETFYVFSVENETSFSVRGDWNSSYSSNNWSWQQAPYIDVNGHSYNERGYTISSDGLWQWAMYTPDDSNNSKFCVQNRDAWFNGNNNAYCVDANGDMTIFGNLKANSIRAPKYAGFINASVPIDNLNGSVTIPSNLINCYENNDPSNFLKQFSISGGVTGSGGIPALVPVYGSSNSFIVGDCGIDGMSPSFTVLSDSSLLDGLRYQLYAVVIVGNGNVLHIEKNLLYGVNLAGKSFTKDADVGGIELSKSTPLSLFVNNSFVSMDGFSAWAGYTKFTFLATSNSTSGRYAYGVGVNRTSIVTSPPSFNDSYYPDENYTLINFTVGYWGIIDVWKVVDNHDEFYMVPMNKEYVNFDLADAETSLVSVPNVISQDGVYVGRIIFQSGNSSNQFAKTFSPLNKYVSATLTTNHNSLSGLQGGDGIDYYHLGLSDYLDVFNKVWDVRIDAVNSSLQSEITNRVNNNTANSNRMNAINSTANIESLDFNTTTQLQSLFYGVSNPFNFLNVSTGQVFNDTSLINAVNTASNIQSLGFNTTSQLGSIFLNVSDQRYNDTVRIDALNLSKGGIGNCSSGMVVQNVTSTGVQCVTPSSSDVQKSYINTYNVTSGSLSMVTQNTYYGITGLGLYNSSGWIVNNVSSVQCNSSGVYEVTFLSTGSVDNNDVINIRVLVNGVAIDRSLIVHRLNTNLDQTINTHFVQVFSVGDNVTLEMRDTSRNNAVFTFLNRELIIVKI